MLAEKTLAVKILSILPVMGQGALLTLYITFVAVTIGLVGGIICGFITAEKVKIRGFWQAITAIEFKSAACQYSSSSCWSTLYCRK